MADGASGLGLAHTHVHTGRGERILQCIVKTSAVYCSATVSLPSGRKVLTQFRLCPSGFFPAEMGMRDSVDWQLGTRHSDGILLEVARL